MASENCYFSGLRKENGVLERCSRERKRDRKCGADPGKNQGMEKLQAENLLFIQAGQVGQVVSSTEGRY